MSTRVHFLKANHGDSILISHASGDQTFNLLIDGGPGKAFKHGPSLRHKGDLCLVLDDIKKKNQNIDLLILTHVDDDHIGGLIRGFEASGYLSAMVKKIWFNSSKIITDYFNHAQIEENDIFLQTKSPDTSVQQGINLEHLLEEHGCKRAPIVIAGQVLEEGPFKFTILSPSEQKLKKLLTIWPTQETDPETSEARTDYSLGLAEILIEDTFTGDTSIANGSSIAFMLEVDGKRALFLGDAHDALIIESLKNLDYSESNQLEVDFVKISHHGSKFNTSEDFLRLIKTKKFIISTDGQKNGLPNKKTIARLLKIHSESKIYFNYESILSKIPLPEESPYFSEHLFFLNESIEL